MQNSWRALATFSSLKTQALVAHVGLAFDVTSAKIRGLVEAAAAVGAGAEVLAKVADANCQKRNRFI